MLRTIDFFYLYITYFSPLKDFLTTYIFMNHNIISEKYSVSYLMTDICDYYFKILVHLKLLIVRLLYFTTMSDILKEKAPAIRFAIYM